LYIDLNNFKTSNDVFGHSVGDNLLIIVTSILKQHFQHQLVIRHGGDEFVVCVPEPDLEQLKHRCQQFLHSLSQPIFIGLNEFTLSACIGVAKYPDDGSSLDELLRKADMAMYEAKKLHQHIYCYSQRLEQKTVADAAIELQLKSALKHHEFSLRFQPQVSAKNNQLAGVEVLIRWYNPQLGQVPPDKFISIAEKTGHIHQIGLWVIKHTLTELNRLDLARMLPNQRLKVAINVSVYQLMSQQFYDDVAAIIAEHDLSHINLMLEITESAFIDDVIKAQQQLIALQQLGLEISLDDFGTGYSSLSVLHKLPLDELKIDQQFTRELLVDAKDRQLIDSIISLGKQFNLAVLAEGVETVQQAQALAVMGCDYFQGYYFAKPLTIEELEGYILANANGHER
jgi:diguanylate cyclase (GGDEF)-like protein